MNELTARQFAQTLVVGEPYPSQVPLSGTVYVQDGEPYVMLDGSNIKTPCVLLMDANDLDRVSVSIEDHVLYVTGNSDKPATNDTEIIGVITGSINIDPDAPSIALGKGDNKLVINEQEIDFVSGDETVAYISQQSLHITDADVQVLHVGKYKWDNREDGSMYLMWEGE